MGRAKNLKRNTDQSIDDLMMTPVPDRTLTTQIRHEIRAALGDLVLPRIAAVEAKVDELRADWQASNNKMIELLADICGELRAMRVGTAAAPASNYSPHSPPLSLGR